MAARELTLVSAVIALGCGMVLVEGSATWTGAQRTAQGAARRLAPHPAEDRAPAWSPDGRTIVFESDRAGNRDLWAMAADGSAIERLTTNPGLDGAPAWSPDARRIVFQSGRAGGAGLWILQRDTGATTLLVADQSDELAPHWSPDGRWIGFFSMRSGNPDLWAVDAQSSELSRLTAHPLRDVWPRWSPDGRSVLFFSRRDTMDRWDELYVMDWRTRDVRRVTVDPVQHHFSPAWSPDGTRIVTALSDQAATRALGIYDLDGRLLRRFAQGLHRVFQPAWAPDGQSIAYAARVTEGEAADIFVEPAPDRTSPNTGLALPSINGAGFGLLINPGTEPVDPDLYDRSPSAQETANVRQTLAKSFPALKDQPTLHVWTCQTEFSVDGQCIFDLHPEMNNVWLVGGGSWHAFKIGPVIGDYVAHRVAGEQKGLAAANLTGPQVAALFKLKAATF